MCGALCFTTTGSETAEPRNSATDTMESITTAAATSSRKTADCIASATTPIRTDRAARGRTAPHPAFLLHAGEAAPPPPWSQQTRPSSVDWRREWDSNPRYGFPYTRFPSVRLQPLGHLSHQPILRAQRTYGVDRICRAQSLSSKEAAD